LCSTRIDYFPPNFAPPFSCLTQNNQSFPLGRISFLFSSLAWFCIWNVFYFGFSICEIDRNQPTDATKLNEMENQSARLLELIFSSPLGLALTPACLPACTSDYHMRRVEIFGCISDVGWSMCGRLR
jgi:hypothetical protein